jgi:hypothetical protein
LFLLFIACTTNAQFLFGIHAGMNLSTQIAKNYQVDQAHNSILTGFNAGVSVENAFSKRISIVSGLSVENKGTRGNAKLGGISADVMNRLLYIDMPVCARINFHLHNVVLFIDAGGYAGIGLTGKALVETADTSKSWKIRWGSSTSDEFRRLDYGVTGGTGIKWNNLSFEGSLDYGLANIFAVKEIGYIIENRLFSLRFVYFF